MFSYTKHLMCCDDQDGPARLCVMHAVPTMNPQTPTAGEVFWFAIEIQMTIPIQLEWGSAVQLTKLHNPHHPHPFQTTPTLPVHSQ